MTEYYHGIILSKEEVQALEDLEELIGGRIPLVKKIEGDRFGYKKEGDRVTELGLYSRKLGSLPESIGNKAQKFKFK